jgi:transcription antitermination factor NusG
MAAACLPSPRTHSLIPLVSQFDGTMIFDLGEKRMTTTIPDLNSSWYALNVHSKCEGRVSTALRGKGYQEFPALYSGHRKWADRMKESEFPLFPGYVFCRFSPSQRLLPILTTPGVRKIVGAGNVPIAIADEEIAGIQAAIRSGLALRSVPFVNLGSRVLVEAGPLKGIEGVVISTDKKCRLAISVQLLQRSVVVEIDREWARPISNHIGPPSVPAVYGSRMF